jgi:N-acetyltransferase 10
MNPLLKHISEVPVTPVDYLGVSFGVTQQLFNFWKRAGFVPLYVRQVPSDITGEHSMIMVRPYGTLDLSTYSQDFRKRMLWLLSYEFRELHPTLAFSIVGFRPTANINSAEMDGHINLYELKRLEAYNHNLIDHSMVLDLIPVLSRLIFEGKLALDLTAFQQALMLGLGLQHRSLKELASLFGMEEQQITAVFNKVMIKAVEQIRGIYEGEISLTLPTKRLREDQDVASPEKKTKE